MSIIQKQKEPNKQTEDDFFPSSFFYDLKTTILDPELIQRLPENIAHYHKVLPLAIKDECLHLGMENVYDITVLDKVKAIFQIPVLPISCPEGSLLKAIGIYYKISSIETLLKQQKNLKETSSVTEIVNLLLLNAVKQESSDIHFDPQEKFVAVRLRIDGVLNTFKTLPKELWPSLSVRLKVMSELNISENRKPQYGRFSAKVSGQDIDFRLSTHPTIYGENIVIRILDKERRPLRLEDLGFEKRTIQNLKKMIARPEGLMIVTGPTGSGKTTTLYSILSLLNTPCVNVMTLEDPVEYKMMQVRQTEIKDNGLLDFEEGVRSILRQDPDIILVGEIRNEETAQMALRAAMTGHKVFATLHTNDAIGSIPRLIDLGLKPSQLSGNVIGFLAQRLVRKLCKYCKTARSFSFFEKELLRIKDDSTLLYAPVGCKLCYETGYKGRIAVGEALICNEKIDDLIFENASRSALLKQAKNDGFLPLKEGAKQKILLGLTTIEEAMRQIKLG